MGEPFDPDAADRQDERFTPQLKTQQDAVKPSHHGPMPFYSQFDYLHQQPQRASTGQYGAFDMSAMGGALPQHSQHEVDGLGMPYPPHQGVPYPGQRGPPMDAAALRAQSQQLLAQQYHAAQMQQSVAHRPQGLNIQPPGPQPRLEMYGCGAPQYSPLDPRFGGQVFPMNMPIDPFGRRPSEPAPVPAYPRGPPRKPKQSGHALWVGNLPPAATITDLKDHFSRDATKDIESLFLISKSNCAFVNYRTEAACAAAMNRFHDSRFHGVRLVCRLRRGSTSSVNSPTASEAPTTFSGEAIQRTEADALPDGLPGDDEQPVIVGQGRTDETGPKEAKKVPEKYFIVKSLTVQDLESSVRNGTWATQSHNEQVLNSAFDMAENVYLIFSANKSGEYFGYARMASVISGEPVKLDSATNGVAAEDVKAAGTPQSIPTAATETAPKGHIIDDSARGTIFWEADLSDDEPDPAIKQSGHGSDGQWGRQFKIEWVSTARLPFFRTRGLRNPWNANREVKIARDGTELEPSVGRRLVAMFHRPPPAQGGMMPAGMAYR